MISEKEMTHAKTDEPTFLQGFQDCVPTLVGYISVGLALGIVGVASHLSVMEIVLMSGLVFAGGAQFIMCALLAANSPMSAIILTTFIVNLRNFLLSAALAPHFSKYSLAKNVGIGMMVTDESFGVASNKIVKKEPINDRWMFGLNLTAYACWVLSCVAGAVFGKWITDPESFGLDFAVTAMFLALLVLQLEHVVPAKLTHYVSLIIYMVIAMVVFSFFMPSHLAVIISTVIVATIGVVTDK
ncbi:Inner membrane protein YgaZ [Bacillus subtilis]|uniref:AzlC family ABC transporter permease n=1 Tax=Bacillus TaxID=1386 RepID=UPI0006A93894|nr:MULTISPECIES: AzlC family ABC transporter permease [Bacillus]MEC2137248.1 AzlC family ABC transporter permease [Bacillus subtilis]NRF44162.1 AzlC family ABC transporter permease [Bacillus subtilis]PJH92586.1 branched-chain amino acid ABC transporter permease [Bacillus sp. SN1]PSI04633.1 branched-chain amino acid ABC transporter permease [Bacillus subtilis]CUB14983.1 Inner membrane protein YgaZ [Bacillus subtilis]